MANILATIQAETIKAIPIIFAALIPTIVWWLTSLRQRAHVRDEVTASAVRQAQAANGGDTPAAEQAAVDELRMMGPKVRPRDPVQAVIDHVDRQRLARVTEPPASPRNIYEDRE